MGTQGNQVGILVAPTESAVLKQLGRSSSIPERMGVDILAPALRWGCQRKAFPDLVASITGERLAKEMLQMRRLVHKVLIIEGRAAWTADGEWLNGFQRFTLDQYWGVIASVQSQGVIVQHTRDIHETVRCVRRMIAWAAKDRHVSLETRPKTMVSQWGTKLSEDFAAWLLQGFDGIGPVQARAILKEFGKVPLRWEVSEQELQRVKGIGKERARKLMRALENGTGGGG